jgi:hypothetical protein
LGSGAYPEFLRRQEDGRHYGYVSYEEYVEGLEEDRARTSQGSLSSK